MGEAVGWKANHVSNSGSDNGNCGAVYKHPAGCGAPSGGPCLYEAGVAVVEAGHMALWIRDSQSSASRWSAIGFSAGGDMVSSRNKRIA